MTIRQGSEKIQPSISAFFKRKSPPSSPSNAVRASGQAPIDIDDDDDEIVDLTGPPPPPPPPIKKAKTSSYFAPKARPTSAQVNAVAGPSSTPSVSRETTLPPAQPNRLQAYRLPPSRIAESSKSGAAFDVFALPSSTAANPGSSSSGSGGGGATAKTDEQKRLHQEWERRVLAPGGIIPRRRSLALDDAAAAEARRMNGDIDGDEGNDTPALEVDDPLESEDESKKKAEGIGEKLAAKYAAKDVKGKGAAKGKKKKEEEVGPSGQTYTPLEKQFMEIKRDNVDVLLLMEVGYKYKFHGEDAKIASKELGIAAFPARNFYTASIPTHRLNIHVKKLISLGYKVGVISQMETAALKKVGENRNAPFTRELTHLFTAATYVEDPALSSSSTITDNPVLPGASVPPTNALLAIVEQPMGGMVVDERARIGIVCVVPETGEVVWDEFDDSAVRTELETRLTHLAPAELLLPAKGLSRATEKLLNHFAGVSKASAGSSVRIEKIEKIPAYDAAFNHLTRFYQRKPVIAKTKNRSGASEEIDLTGDSDGDVEDSERLDAKADSEGMGPSTQDREANPLELAAGLASEEAVLALVDFPKQIVVALSVAVKYMKSFGLENAFRHRSSFIKFINRAHMLLSSNTLINLEIYQNQTDGGIYGSLLWLLDHCKTRMGRRLLREWIGRPLLDVVALQARIDAIEEIMNSNTYHMEKLKSLLVNMPDLVKGLTRVQYGKATPTEVATLLVALNRVGSEFKPVDHDIFTSSLLNNIVKILPTIKDISQDFLKDINVKSARENDEASLWSDPDKYPEVQDAKDCISICESELDQHLHDIRKTLKRPSLAYVTVAGIEYLVEVPTRDSKSVPPKWVKISSTKSVHRFHTPEVLRIAKEREQHKETLAAASRRAFLSFQADISEHHELVLVSKQLAVIDCLMSLAQVAAAAGYSKPVFVTSSALHIREGRHPMVEMLRDEAYVPFDIDFSEVDGQAKVITGPNMAGKSSCVRATALIVCMAQIGSFVPAASVTLGIHDAVQTRMGASDEIGRGKSTFMVELSETSDILRTLTPRTLVILDELGRGTSTYDGVAIAYATLSHLAGVGCNTLFVTHYPMVAEELSREFPKQISNWHMSFSEITLPDGSAEITFLYKLTRGLAEASFGVWCARLAGLPRSVLDKAQSQSERLKQETQERLLSALIRRSRRLFRDTTTTTTTPSSSPASKGRKSDVLRNVRILYKALQLAERE